MVKMDKGTALIPSKSGSTQKMAANITVVVRVRPMNDRELGQNNRTVIEVIDENQLVFDPKEDLPPFFYQGVQQPSKNYLKRANKEMKFAFDSVCGPNASNQDVFESATKDMLAALMEGYNCSVFVYGATGAGKTFTMIGSKEHPGITYLTMDHLFHTINGFQMDREFDIAVSYIEVYNENVFDLLNKSSTPLQLRDYHQYGVTVAGLSIHKIETAKELLDMLEFGNRNRTQHPTDANAESSRSHAVFQVYVTMRCKTSSQCRNVKLSMIDLAGSERASATGCVGERFKEGANINRSLLALGNCINKLADGSSYIPYRDSKLTRLLKDSLGGNCKTVMIANVSPSSLCYEDTYNTLKYAARANKIQLSIKKNIVDGNMNSSQCLKMNKELQRRLEEVEKKYKEVQKKMELQAKLAVSTNIVAVDIKAKKALWSQRINEVELIHGALESKLLSLMSQQRVVALRHFLRTRAFKHVADLAHRSSCDALEQICTEDIPRQERASETYTQKQLSWNLKIMDVWKKWTETGKKLQNLLNDGIADCPDLNVYVEIINLRSKNRISDARNDLKETLFSMMKNEITVFTECMGDAFNMLKKVYLTLKGYGHAPPTLTMEYLEIINKVKSAKGISWSDDVKIDPHFKFILTLDLENPIAPIDFSQDQDVKNSTIDVITDSDDLADIENQEPCTKKRKGTPIKLQNNETIIINDSFEALDTQNINSAKKFKMERAGMENLNDFGELNPADLNSTFVLAGKMDVLRKLPVKAVSNEVQPMKRGLTDRTNTIQRTISFNNDNKARIVKPVLPVKRVGTATPQPRGPAFGSSVPRDGTNFRTAVRGRERPQAHPYSRPGAYTRK
ncbi:kinesin-like protein KIF18A isoform X3 [Maniola jurtina]|uniref:kinesin-like protein KIF18A isoform X3 n=1 Tax=Maniola jurtina TaxID=191418 RepID=UPI001E68B57A|nr:kinesin-like protein KIF18A isoform X3 [Maniola jurtina]XP_045764887.1 kinesin-like protein KIF18A isoform X3 [Maniola jurtina]